MKDSSNGCHPNRPSLWKRLLRSLHRVSIALKITRRVDLPKELDQFYQDAFYGQDNNEPTEGDTDGEASTDRA